MTCRRRTRCSDRRWPVTNRGGRRQSGAADAGEDEPGEDLSNPNNWPLGKVVAEKGFTTDTNGVAKLSFKLARARIARCWRRRIGLAKRSPASSRPGAAARGTKLAIKIPQLMAAPDWEVQPGQEFMALWGTGYETGRAFIEIEHRHK